MRAVANVVGIPTLIYVLCPTLGSDAAERWGNLGSWDLFTVSTVRAAAVIHLFTTSIHSMFLEVFMTLPPQSWYAYYHAHTGLSPTTEAA